MNGTRQHFLAFTMDAQSKVVLSQFAHAKGWGTDCVHEGDATRAAEFLANNPSPHVLCVDISGLESAESALDRLAEVCAPDSKVIVLGNINEYSFFCWLMEMGISSYLLNPLTEQAIHKAYNKATSAQMNSVVAAAPELQDAKMIAVIGMRGGVGATAISVNIASLFSHTFHKKTALIDLDPHYGNVALAFDLDPVKGLRDVLEKPERVDSFFLDRVMTSLDDELSILSTEEALEETITIADSAPEIIMEQIRAKFSYIVMDVPRHFSILSRYALQRADYILCVTEYTLSSLREALRFQDYCRDHLKRSSPVFVANRVGMTGKQQIPLEEFEKGLGQQVVFNIPYTLDMLGANTAGEVLVETKNDIPATRALYGLAAHFVPDAAPLPVKNKWHALQGLFGKAQ